MITILLTVVAPIFAIAAIGFLWVRAGQKFDNHFISTLVTYVGTPCLLLRTFNERVIDLEAFGSMVLASAVLMAVMAAAGSLVLHALRLSPREYLPTLLFPNVANIGLPVVLFALGEEGLALAMVVLVFQTVAHNTVGIAIYAGRTGILALFRMPVLYAVMLGLVLMVTGLRLPEWAARSTDLLGNLTIPLMLLALGASIARLRVTSLKTSMLVTALRIAGGLAAAVLVAWLLDLNETERGVLILQGSMPVAVLAYLYAEKFGSAAKDVAGVVFVSTLASLLTVPFAVWFVSNL